MHNLALNAYVRVSARVREMRELGSERGLTTTEIAILTFVLVATAVAVGTVLYNYANGQVADLPDDPTEGFGEPVIAD